MNDSHLVVARLSTGWFNPKLVVVDDTVDGRNPRFPRYSGIAYIVTLHPNKS